MFADYIELYIWQNKVSSYIAEAGPFKFYKGRNADTGLHYDDAQLIATSAKRKLRGKVRRGMSGMIVTHEC